MKKLTLLILFCMTSINVSASGSTCVLDEKNKLLSRLAEEVNADCNWSIREVVEAGILQECREAPRSVGVSFKGPSGESLRFTEYSYTYDVNDSFYFCKNNSGYRSYLSQTISILRSEVRENRRSNYRPSTDSSYSRAYVEEVKEVKWSCVVPNYIPIPKVYSASQKEVLDITHGHNPRYFCSKLK